MTTPRRNVSFSVVLWLIVVAFAAGVVVGHLLPDRYAPADPIDAGK